MEAMKIIVIHKLPNSGLHADVLQAAKNMFCKKKIAG
jgi:hypothetical protein